MSKKTYVIALDQGTQSTRAIIFDDRGIAVCSEQLTHEQFTPHAGWVEHDANGTTLCTRLTIAPANVSRPIL